MEVLRPTKVGDTAVPVLNKVGGGIECSLLIVDNYSGALNPFGDVVEELNG